MAKKKTTAEGEKGSKIDPNVVIAIIGAITTIAVAIIPFLMNRANSESPETPTPLVITATTAADLPTETPAPIATETSTAALTPITEPATPTNIPQIGIYNGYLATDFNGNIPSTRFKPGEIIYLLFDINDPTNKNVIRVVWLVVEAKGYLAGAIKSDTPYVITSNNFTTLSDHSSNPWTVGKYKVEIYLNNVLDEIIEFEIVP